MTKTLDLPHRQASSSTSSSARNSIYYVDEPTTASYISVNEPKKFATLDHPRRTNNNITPFSQFSTSTLNTRMESLEISQSPNNTANHFNQSYSSAITRGTTDRFSTQHSPSASSSHNSSIDEHAAKQHALQLHLNVNSTDSDFVNWVETTNSSNTLPLVHSNSMSQNDILGDDNGSLKSSTSSKFYKKISIDFIKIFYRKKKRYFSF